LEEGGAARVGLIRDRVEPAVHRVLGRGGEDEPFAAESAEGGDGLPPRGFSGQGPEVPDLPELLPAPEDHEGDLLVEVFGEVGVPYQGLDVGVERPAILQHQPGRLLAGPHGHAISTRRVSLPARILYQELKE
jgi:hypothetical protein